MGGWGWGCVVITRFKAKTQFKLDLTGTGLRSELGNKVFNIGKFTMNNFS